MTVPGQINEAGLALIKKFEGVKLDAYQDVAGIWTIGYGHIRGVQPGMHITSSEAEEALKDDIASAEAAVQRCVENSSTSENQYSAMVCLCFNIGSANFRASTVLKKHLEGSFKEAADAFLLWDKSRVGGVLQKVAGLAARRASERELYLLESA